MTQYWSERIVIGFLIGALYLGTSLIIGNKFDSWIFIFLVMVTASLVHFFTAWFYQLKSLRKAENPRKAGMYFLLLFFSALLLSGALIITGHVLLLYFIVISYFMVHTFLNEITLYNRTTQKTPDNRLITMFVLVTFGLIMFSLQHPASTMTPTIEFLMRNDFMIRIFLANSFAPTLGLILGSVSMGLAALVGLSMLIKNRENLLRNILLIASLGAITLLAIMKPPNYIYVVCAILLYHYIIWFWFYLRQFQKHNKKMLKGYFILHAIILLPFVFAFYPNPVGNWVHLFILNSYFALPLAMAHISTSFMSEQWFKERVLNK